ncbi:hypothetical protein KEM56_000885, partial [Ascosphaera pollenicola]
SAYLLGADGSHLNKLYEGESQPLSRWAESPSEIIRDDWRDYLGKKEYQRAYVDFFEDEIYHLRYDWEGVLRKYLFEGKQPLVNNLASGDYAHTLTVTHPLIHLAYAYELGHKDVAVEALVLATTSYDDNHKYIESPTYLKGPALYSTKSILEILTKIRNDSQFDGIIRRPGYQNIELLFSKYEGVLLDHWRAWDLTPVQHANGKSNLNSQFQQAQYAAAALVVASSTSYVDKDDNEKKHDFFLLHILTSLHAIRVLLPIIPTEFHVSLLRQWHLIVISLYITQLRPNVDPGEIARYPTRGRDWSWAEMQALTGEWAADAHFVKAVRAFKAAGATWEEEKWWYLRAALKFIDEFRGWGGRSVDVPNMKKLR